MRFQLYAEQQLNCELEKAWAFFSSPLNLSKITPKNMGFRILSNLADTEIKEGMIIRYTVSPLFRLPLKWVTKITQVNKNISFTDFQEKGPYRYWNHFHEFIPNDNGVLMKDTVDYELPFGFVGRIAHSLFVRKKLEQIFNYRFQVIEQLFNQIN